MLREQFINFPEAAVLALTNAFSVLAAAYAISIAHGLIRTDPQGAEQHGLLNLLAGRLRINH
jgi:hypothetical protein